MSAAFPHPRGSTSSLAPHEPYARASQARPDRCSGYHGIPADGPFRCVSRHETWTSAPKPSAVAEAPSREAGGELKGARSDLFA
jgi:hypothetical protein